MWPVPAPSRPSRHCSPTPSRRRESARFGPRFLPCGSENVLSPPALRPTVAPHADGRRPREAAMNERLALALLVCGGALAGSDGAAAQSPAAASRPAYIIYDTGTLSGGVGVGNGINDIGWISGLSSTATGAFHAALWS